jgi:hypothetical protein
MTPELLFKFLYQYTIGQLPSMYSFKFPKIFKEIDQSVCPELVIEFIATVPMYKDDVKRITLESVEMTDVERLNHRINDLTKSLEDLRKNSVSKQELDALLDAKIASMIMPTVQPISNNENLTQDMDAMKEAIKEENPKNETKRTTQLLQSFIDNSNNNLVPEEKNDNKSSKKSFRRRK